MSHASWPWQKRFKDFRAWLDAELRLSVARRDNPQYDTETRDFHRGQAVAYSVAIDRLYRLVLQDDQQSLFGEGLK
jgi:hypothetical protein